MEKVRLGVVGVGWVAQVFHLPILKKLNDVEIAAVCDRDKARAATIAVRFDLSHS